MKNTNTKIPFDWITFDRMAAENPDLDVLGTFSFDHLYGEDMEKMLSLAYDSTRKLQASLAYSFRVLEHLTRLRLRELNLKADVVDFPSTGNSPETLQ